MVPQHVGMFDNVKDGSKTRQVIFDRGLWRIGVCSSGLGRTCRDQGHHGHLRCDEYNVIEDHARGSTSRKAARNTRSSLSHTRRDIERHCACI